jgi:hypothetical protein
VTYVYHMNLIDFCVSCEPFIFNEKKQILPMCAARFFLLLFSQIWATLHKKKDLGDASLLIYLSLQPRLLSSVRALDFHGRSGLAAPKIWSFSVLFLLCGGKLFPVLVSPRTDGVFPLRAERVGEERQGRPTSVLRCITGSVFPLQFLLSVAVH